MTFDVKPIEHLTETDLQKLVDAKAEESKNLEFKESLPGEKYDDKKEFLADATSLANTDGGYLIYGIKETEGVASELVGLEGNPDQAILRLESALRTGVQPRLSAYTLRNIPLTKERYILLFKIERSWSMPHRVTLQGHDKFYARGAKGKYDLDVGQLRSLFALSETTAEKLRSLRTDRVIQIRGNNTPTPMGNGPKVVLHFMPLSSFTHGTALNLSTLLIHNMPQLPLLATGHSILDWKHNFDGIVKWAVHRTQSHTSTYTQFFRNGIIEAVDTKILSRSQQIPGLAIEEEIIKYLISAFSTYNLMGIQPPIFIMLSILGVKGYMMNAGHRFGENEENKIDRDLLLIPEIMSENDSQDAGTLLKPAFDMLWNAAGYPASPYYNAEGKRDTAVD